MKKKQIHNINIFMFRLWSSKVHFFLAKKDKVDLFIKLYRSTNKNIREVQVLLQMQMQMHETKSSDYVPRLIEYGKINGGFILVIEKVNGFSLLERMGDLDFNISHKILEQFIKILEDLELNSIVHCDIRPDNVLLSDRNEIKVIDFEYAVYKENIEISDLHFENKYILKNLGAHYAKGDYIWDDAYSFYKIGNEIIMINDFTEKELVALSEIIDAIKLRIGRNIYAY